MKTKPFEVKKPTAFIPDAVDKMIDNGVQKEIFLPKWHDHVLGRHVITSFSTIVGDKLYHVVARDKEIIMPFEEHFGDHIENWIIIVDTATNKEIWRKNVKTVDTIEWKLSSFLTNTETDGE